MNKTNIVNDIFLLMITLSSIKHRGELVNKFTHALSSLWEEIKFFHSFEKNEECDKAIELKTDYKDYGYIYIQGEYKNLSAYEKSLINNSIHYLILLLSDIDQRELLENKVNKLENAIEEHPGQFDQVLSKTKESVNVFKNDLLGIMSHELRTPLTGIIGFSELFLNQAKNSGEFDSLSNYIEYVNYIYKSALRLNEVLSNVIELAAIKAGQKKKLQYQNVDVENLICNICNIFEDKIKILNLDINIKIKTDKLIPLPINRFKQIMYNLISNAIKFTPKGNVTVTVWQKNNDFLFKIKDTGIGIEKKLQNEIFELFTQLDNNVNTRKYEGAGLGLSVCHKLITELNGNIGLESEPDRGSEFWFSIPMKNAVHFDETHKDIAEITQENKKIRVLFAEDEEINYKLLKTLFDKDNDFEAKGFSNGKKLLEEYQQNKNFDIILLDIYMPVMDGFSCLHKLRNMDKDIPIIAFTALSVDIDRKKILQSGFNEYILKPISEKELKNKIKNALNKKTENK